MVKKEQQRQEAQLRREVEGVEEFDVWTEASVDLEEPQDAPDYVPKGYPQSKAKGKGKGRGMGGSSSSSSSAGGDESETAGSNANDWLNVTLRDC